MPAYNKSCKKMEIIISKIKKIVYIFFLWWSNIVKQLNWTLAKIAKALANARVWVLLQLDYSSNLKS